MYACAVQCNIMCSLSSLSFLHSKHVGETECWLNLARFACRVYVPAMILALMLAFLTARVLLGTVCQIGCEFLVGCFCSVRYFSDVLSSTSLYHSVMWCSSTALFSIAFHFHLVGGLSIKSYAVGKLYSCMSFLMCVNQLLLFWSFIASYLMAISCSTNSLLVAML
jgi:hypothetical protein